MKFFNQFTPEQMKTQYKKNAAQLRTMEEKAACLGVKVNGYTREQLKKYAEEYERKAV